MWSSLFIYSLPSHLLNDWSSWDNCRNSEKMQCQFFRDVFTGVALSDRKVPVTRVTLPLVNTVNRNLQQANLFYVSGCICQSWTSFACCFIYSRQERSVHNLNFIFQWQEVRDLVIGNVTSHRSLFFYPLCNTFYRKKKVFFQRPSCRKQQSK